MLDTRQKLSNEERVQLIGKIAEYASYKEANSWLKENFGKTILVNAFNPRFYKFKY